MSIINPVCGTAVNKLPSLRNADDPTAVEMRTGQVNEQLELVRREVIDNSEIIAHLGDELQSVLQPSPEHGKQPGEPEEYMVPLAADLRGIYKNMRAQNIRLREILNAIEL